jgi:hypothetical protein
VADILPFLFREKAKQISKKIGSYFPFSENKFAKLRNFATKERKKENTRIWSQIFSFQSF